MAAGANAKKHSPKDLPSWLRRGPNKCRFCGGTDAHDEKCSIKDPERPDFRHLDLTDVVMAEGEGPMLEKLREAAAEHGFDDARFETAIALQKLRRRTHELARRDLEMRLKRNPVPTEEELSMGAFVENLEPQVRDAVVLMRRKGYTTASSGFASFDLQAMILQTPDFTDLTDDERAELKELGVDVSKDDGSFSFRCERADIGAIKTQWDKIANALPNLGRSAPDADHGAAESFRKKYGRP